MPHGNVYSRAGIADGPRRRISVQRNAGSSPSIASTTSSTVISVGGPRQPVAAARTLHRLEHPGARERLEVLGEYAAGTPWYSASFAAGSAAIGREHARASCTRARPTRHRPRAA